MEFHALSAQEQLDVVIDLKTKLVEAQQQRDELQTRYDAAHSELIRMTEQLAACRSAANELERERDHYKEMDALHIESLGLKSVELAAVTFSAIDSRELYDLDPAMGEKP